MACLTSTRCQPTQPAAIAKDQGLAVRGACFNIWPELLLLLLLLYPAACSFTLATLPTALGTMADVVMLSIKAAGLTNYYINLMVMDYGDAACTKSTVTGKCDMGQSAIDAANMLHTKYGEQSTEYWVCSCVWYVAIARCLGGNQERVGLFHNKLKFRHSHGDLRY